MDPTLKAVLASWQWRPDVALAVAGLAAVYVSGWCRLRRRKPEAAGPWELVLYLSGLAVGHAGRQGHPGIVHQDVDLPQLLPDTLQRGLHVGRPGHVAAHADRLAPDELPDLSSALQECTENLNRIIDVVQAHGSRVVMMGRRRWRASLMGEEVVKLLRSAGTLRVALAG